MRMVNVGRTFVMVLLAVVLVGFVTGCASANKQLVVADATLHGGLSSLDDKVHAFCKDTKNAVYAAPCADANAPMIALLKAGDAFNRGVAAEKVTGFSALLSASSDVIKVFAKLPAGETAAWIRDLTDIIKAASAQAVK